MLNIQSLLSAYVYQENFHLIFTFMSYPEIDLDRIIRHLKKPIHVNFKLKFSLTLFSKSISN
jgi:hypothetical protein